MASRSFHFKMNDTDPLDKQIIDWLVRNPNRSDCIREALRVYFFLREHGIPVVPVEPEPTGIRQETQEAGAEPFSQPDDLMASEFFQAMRAGVEDWV